MEGVWNDLSTRSQQGKLGRDEAKFFKKLVKALGYLREDPRHNSLASQEGLTVPRKQQPELTFQQHIAKFLVREHKYGMLEQTA